VFGNVALSSTLDLVILDNVDLHKLMCIKKIKYSHIPHTSTRNMRARLVHRGDYIQQNVSNRI